MAQHNSSCIVGAWQVTTKGQFWIETMHEYFGDDIKNTLLINIFGSAVFIKEGMRLEEHHIAGLGHLGTVRRNRTLARVKYSATLPEGGGPAIIGNVVDTAQVNIPIDTVGRLRLLTYSGFTRYELSNFRGDVQVVLSDRRLPQQNSSIPDSITSFTADIWSAQDFYPFGMLMLGRTWESTVDSSYLYGIQGQLRDDEIYGAGNSYSADFWQYDSRLARRWNVDPKGAPSVSFYSCFANNPILFTDQKGDTIRTNKEGY